MFGWTLFAAVVTGIVALLLVTGFIRTWRLYHGVRVITCPENHESAAVRVAAIDAAKSFALRHRPDIHLKACSRWPAMEGCDEACRTEIDADPQACSLHSIVASWYEGRHCHFCAKEIGEIVWHERPPAVTLPDGTIHEWKDVPPERLPSIFKTGEAVCWPCFLVETSTAEHPELVLRRARPADPHHAIEPSTSVY